MAEFERIVNFTKAYDCIRVQPCVHGSERCTPGGGGSHGIGSVKMITVLKGELGAVQFALHTHWYLPVTPSRPVGIDKPLPAGLDYHSPKPLWEGQEEYGRSDCHLLPGGVCYFDGSGLNAYHPWWWLLNEGEDGLWRFLEEYYRNTFEGAEMTMWRSDEETRVFV